MSRCARALVALVAAVVALALGAPPALAKPDCNAPDPPPICDGPAQHPGHPDPRKPPFGHVDEVVSTADGLRVSGWVIDPDQDAPAQVEIAVDGAARTTVLADRSRPDVAAAFPAFTERHGFSTVLPPPRRHTTVCATGLKIGGGPSAVVGCGRDPRALSILDLNIRGLQETWPNDDGVGTNTIDWRTRYWRITSWMQQFRTHPDIIALQELPVRYEWFPFGNLDPADYEALAVIVDRIKLMTGADYRIAYASATTQWEGIHHLTQGRAMLYDAARVRNTTPELAGRPTASDRDETTVGPHVRVSSSCGLPRTNDICSKIDLGGPHWVAAHINSRTGTWARGAAAATFELLSDPGRQVLVVNVHQDPLNAEGNDGDPDDAAALRSLVDTAAAAVRSRPALLPPIVTGDFNGGFEMLAGDFEEKASPVAPGWDTVDYVLLGRPDVYPTSFAPAVETQVYPQPIGGRPHCGGIATLLSDHCAVFAQFLPAD